MYYTALLVSVGCHTDAHEQAKWFGDDIALKADKYDHELRSLRAAAAGMRRLGSGHAGVCIASGSGSSSPLSGHQEVADMITQHATDGANRWASSSACRSTCSTRSVARTSSWDGRGWPGELKGEDIPIAARVAQLAEFIEVAYRVGGVQAARDARPRARRQAVRPRRSRS